VFEGCGVDLFVVEIFFEFDEFMFVIEVVWSVLLFLIFVMFIFDVGVETFLGF